MPICCACAVLASTFLIYGCRDGRVSSLTPGERELLTVIRYVWRIQRLDKFDGPVFVAMLPSGQRKRVPVPSGVLRWLTRKWHALDISDMEPWHPERMEPTSRTSGKHGVLITVVEREGSTSEKAGLFVVEVYSGPTAMTRWRIETARDHRGEASVTKADIVGMS